MYFQDEDAAALAMRFDSVTDFADFLVDLHEESGFSGSDPRDTAPILWEYLQMCLGEELKYRGYHRIDDNPADE